MTEGRLLLGATPLGQPSDASPRLIAALSTADIVAAEDTRRIRTLAKALDVESVERSSAFSIMSRRPGCPRWSSDQRGRHRCSWSATPGMPLINDPGHRLVAACVEAGLQVQCLPGPSAVTTALAVSGLPSEKFCFEGFAPRKQAARKSWLASLAAEQRTAVFFESPRRLAACLADAVDQLGGDRRAAVCRELTKVHEEVVRGSLDELAEWAADGVLGEITVVLAGAVVRADLPTLVAQASALVDEGMGVKDACAQVIAATPGAASRRELYDAVLRSRG